MEAAGDQRLTDTRQDEQDRCITIKSTGISLYYQMEEEDLARFTGKRDGNDFLVNLIDSPGHVDFSSEVTAALRITDGALVVVDCVEGVCVQTETVLRQALGERIRPVMTVNKLDRCFLELMLEGEDAYNGFRRVIETANVIMATYADEMLGDTQVYPEKGTVSFSAGLHGWAFTLTVFSAIYAKRFGVEEAKMMEKLWGDNFFDPTTKKWTKKPTGAATCKRGFVQVSGREEERRQKRARVFFCFFRSITHPSHPPTPPPSPIQFVYDPIKTIIEAAINDNKEKLFALCDKLGISAKIKAEDRELVGKPLMKRIMQAWLPAHEALLEMMIYHLPSPAAAQVYRVENLYEGPLDDIYAQAIRTCDPNGPLMLYVSKMIPASDKGRFYAFGRVFAGKVREWMGWEGGRRRKKDVFFVSFTHPPHTHHPTSTDRHRPKGPHHGPQLHPRPEEGPVRQDGPAHRALHGAPPGSCRRRPLRQHGRHGRPRPVHHQERDAHRRKV